MEEVWRPVVGYEGLYEVSNVGRLRNLGRRRVPRIRGHFIEGGYPQVVLYRKGQARTDKVHRIVAAAFIGPRPVAHQVNHIDGVKTNNAATNLEYVTPLQNIRHAQALGLLHTDPQKVRGERNGKARLTEAAVREIRRLRPTTSATEIAARLGVHRATVDDVVKGRRWAWLP